MAKATNKLLQKYGGGQIEIQNKPEGYLYRGEIKFISLENDVLKVELVWFAKDEGFPRLAKHWVKTDHVSCATSIGNHACTRTGDDCLSFTSAASTEIIVLFPPNEKNLKPFQVEGLRLPLKL